MKSSQIGLDVGDEVVAATPYFPSMVMHMAKAGEQTGNIDGMMSKISDFYDNEVENIVNSLTSLMEPLLIVFMGGAVGFIVIALFMPLIEIINQLGG